MIIYYKHDWEHRFWSKIIIPIDPNACWEWQGCRTKQEEGKGYGRLKIRGVHNLVHKLMYELIIGIIPESLFVLHHCDNRICVNPIHLFIGTLSDNAIDREQKGRGYKLGNPKLSQEQIIYLLQVCVPLGSSKKYRQQKEQLATSLAINPQYISHLVCQYRRKGSITRGGVEITI